ncbi:hypothetical protein EJ05DRAFT_152509 [Pseudovirgaria hyperparasitica]|uniref:mRNA export factor MEX67 n=1 Tax=Pseudovirgaria hyperparasitica TaxID=470096 RepID=A0A6A6VZG9_9PEZI|nr:uncharacterized protein EJ05DRAFT_152509 [Pseudovirgaria hyperparasitica]KAF2754201.1 hypothetical protein EJ05DRAFT_152509 [Pseudovirgaria hyperparasitica]
MAPAVSKRVASSDGFARGAAHKRRSGVRTDRDGDLMMDATPRNQNNKIGKGRGKPTTNTSTTTTNGTAKPRNNIHAKSTQNAIIRHLTSGNANIKQAQPSNIKSVKVSGWKNSKASTNEDGGVHSLLTFLEKKVTTNLTKKSISNGNRKPVQVSLKKYHIDGDAVIISTTPDVGASLCVMNKWVWAGVNLQIEPAQQSNAFSDKNGGDQEMQADARPILTDLISRRYNADLKLLDLSGLASDPQLKANGVLTSIAQPANFFPALMKVCDEQFKTAQEKRDTVFSVTLANNDLRSVSPVTTLAQTFPDLKNLDLSNNKIPTLSSMINWKHKFRALDQLLLNGNPLEQQDPAFYIQIRNWYPALRTLNNQQIRTDQEALQSSHGVKKALPVRGPMFHDEGDIAKNFIISFFAGYDTDRAALVNMYYDTESIFSFSLNNRGISDPLSRQKMEKQEWDAYIRKSRNLKALSHLPARVNRQYTGPAKILEIISSLPKTRHPDLGNSGQKWCIECQSLPSVPDATRQHPGGVGGLIIDIHGEFEELDERAGNAEKSRSFDRNFVLGPGVNGGVRIVSDTLTIRAYGGFAAWKPDELESNGQQEPLITEVCRRTGMIVSFSKQCLEESGWNLEEAIQRFEGAKAAGLIPAEAFVQA